MNGLATLKQLTVKRLNELPPHRLVQALDFIQYLLGHPESVVPSVSELPTGSLDDLLACVGSWQFDPGELDQVLQEIDQSRLMELDDTYASLLA